MASVWFGSVGIGCYHRKFGLLLREGLKKNSGIFGKTLIHGQQLDGFVHLGCFHEILYILDIFVQKLNVCIFKMHFGYSDEFHSVLDLFVIMIHYSW